MHLGGEEDELEANQPRNAISEIMMAVTTLIETVMAGSRIFLNLALICLRAGFRPERVARSTIAEWTMKRPSLTRGAEDRVLAPIGKESQRHRREPQQSREDQ